MVEEAIESFVEAGGLQAAIFVLIVGAAVLMIAAGKLISYLTRAALGLGASLFALAIVFTGFEFDDTILAVVLASGELEGAALGTALGTALAIVGVTLALAAIVKPFPVDLPADYLLLFAVSPLILVPFVLLGTLTFVHGLALLGLFAAMFGYLIYREHQRDVPVFRSSEIGKTLRVDGGIPARSGLSSIPEDRLIADRPNAGWLWLALSLAALVGVVAGAMLLEAGSEVLVEELAIEETVFGATILTLILTFEDVLLTLEPVRRGIPEIGVGNVIGSVLFSVTGNIGVIMLVGDLRISRSVLTFHLPAVILVTALAAYFFSTGGIERRHGIVLGGLYVAYWLVAILAFGGVPISG